MRNSRDNKTPFKESLGASSKDDTETQRPIFSFEKMKDHTGYSVNCCQKNDQAALAKRLFALSQIPWKQIRQADRHGLGTEIIARGSIVAPLPSSVTEDTTLLAFRFSGKKPMIGYKEGRIFYVLILDHQFKAYDHG